MALFKRKTQQSQASIRLAPRSCDDHLCVPPDRFLSDETVNGCAVIKLAPGADFSHTKISLKGIIRTTTEDTHTGALGRGWRVEQLPFLSVSYSDKARNIPKSDDGSVRIPFHFDLTKCERLAQFVPELPPSLDSRVDGQKTSEGQYEIVYSITATAFSTKSVLVSATEKISVLPVSPDVLSTQHSEAPNEYHWAQLQSLVKPRNHRLQSSGSTRSSGSVSAPLSKIELAGQEPESIVFNHEDSTPEGTTEVPFVVKFSPHAAPFDAPMPTECMVKAHLVTKTHVTPDGLKQIGSGLEFMRTGGSHVTKSHNGFEVNATLPITGWESCLSPGTDPFSVARFTFQYNIRHEKPPTPTFFTPLLSRRYFLELSVSFPERPTEAYNLTLPIEVAHGSVDGLSEDDRKKSRDSSPGLEARL